MAERFCVVCDKALKADNRGRFRSTCGSRYCRGKATHMHTSQKGEWPKVTGEIVADFSKHDLKFKRSFVKVAMPDPIDRTYGGVGSRWMA